MRLALAFLLLATAARGETLVGVVVSQGMGEGKLAPYIEQRADVEWFGPLILTVAYRHRDGGAWTKRGVWLGAGIGSRTARLTARQEIGGNRTLALGAALRWGHVEAQATGYRYAQSGAHRHGITVLLGCWL